MEQGGPVLRDGGWWQLHDGVWFRWDDERGQWLQGGAPPPPPPPAPATPMPDGPIAAPAPSAPEPAPAYTGSGRPVDPAAAGDTWGSVTIGAGIPRTFEGGQVAAPRTGRKAGPIAAGALVATALIGALLYFFVFSGDPGPSAEDIDAAFGSLRGFGYEDAPEVVMDEVRKTVERDPTAAEVVGEFDFRMIKRGGRPIGGVAILGLDPKEMQDVGPVSNDSLLAGFHRGTGLAVPGTSARQVKRAKTMMYEFTAPGAALTVFVDEKDGMIFSIATMDARATRAISKQLARANL